MLSFLQLFIVIPLLAFIASLMIPRKNEIVLSSLVWATIGIQLVLTTVFIGYWVADGFPILDNKYFVLYQDAHFEFFIDFYFDKITAVFALIGVILVFLVSIFSRYYMHRDEGFKRFFNILLFFFLGYNFIVFSGNLETLFVGWEIMGICSFLLISFYRDRYLPVKNGYKVISFYRLSDICLILAMWLSHHIWQRSITFWEWNDVAFLQKSLSEHHPYVPIICILVIIAASIKSAQIPFSTWLPRAMEGPTTSSAIFYGSLSVHIGVFMLIRTYPLWENELFIKGIVIAIGLLTSLIGTTIARVQPTVKTQIAYASITQIGLMFVEVALGFHTLALIHFTSNAFLRTYQLLVSPSVLGYLVHDIFFNFKPKTAHIGNTFLHKISHTLYLLGIKEWNLDFLLNRYVWSPFKWIGNKLSRVNKNLLWTAIFLLLAFGIYLLAVDDKLTETMKEYDTILFSFVALLMILNAFVERGDARKAWLILFGSQLFIGFSVLFIEGYEWHHMVMYLGGSSFAAIVGYVCLNKIYAMDGDIDLKQYHGYSYEKPKIALIFLLSSLGLIGFPITPSFIGIDLMFTLVHHHEIELITIMAFNFLFLELSVLRIYTRVFLGQHKKAYHPIAFKSS